MHLSHPAIQPIQPIWVPGTRLILSRVALFLPSTALLSMFAARLAHLPTQKRPHLILCLPLRCFTHFLSHASRDLALYCMHRLYSTTTSCCLSTLLDSLQLLPENNGTVVETEAIGAKDPRRPNPTGVHTSANSLNAGRCSRPGTPLLSTLLSGRTLTFGPCYRLSSTLPPIMRRRRYSRSAMTSSPSLAISRMLPCSYTGKPRNTPTRTYRFSC